MIRIPFYESTTFVFHNFSAHKIEHKGRTYPTLEHAYHAAKFSNPAIQDEVSNAGTPLEAKYLANIKYKDSKLPDWNSLKTGVMLELLRAKAMQHAEVRNALLNTGGELIVEESIDDYFWGSGKDGTGQNQTGKLLMKIRDELRSTKEQISSNSVG